MNQIIRRCIPLLLIGALAACEPEDLATVFVPSGDGVEYAEMPVFIDVSAGEPETKAPVLSGADDPRRGGVLFLVYRSSTKQLDSYRFFTPAELAAASSNPLKIRVPLVNCDIYVLGNLLAVKKADASVTTNLMEALGTAFPVDEEGLEALEYRLDGGNINSTWRREKMAEVAKYGIPFGYVDRDVPVASLLSAGKSVPRGKPAWMFSRVEVTVDHGLFDGGDPAKVGYFVNRTLKMKQANLRLLPFSTSPVKALTAGDSGDGDLDPSMTNGAGNTYVFFVPENMQGVAPASAFAAEPDASKKNRLKVPSNTLIPAACRNYGTYVEFKGTLDKDAGGFGGGVTYQFYLGANETTDFNLERGRKYKILLKFTADGLFHPDWRVQPDLTDTRLFRLTADAAFSTDIGDVNAGRTLAVRGNRAGALYVYMNPGGRLSGTNLLQGKEVRRPEDFVMADLSDCAWYGAFMTSGTADAKWLAARGITPAWDKAGARLEFSVTDAAKYRSHLGESRKLTLTLLPGGTVTASFTLKLLQDLSLTVADGKSLTDAFYLGQKRTVSVSGFAGSNIKYAAVQEGCGAAAKTNTRKTSNVQWKPTNKASSAFPSCAVDAAGRVVLNVSDPAYSAQGCSGTLDVYAFYPNRFQPSHSGWSSKNGKIVFFSEDFLNDSMEVDVRISEPMLKPPTEAATLVTSGSESYFVLPIDGNEVATDGGYYDFAGRNRLDASSFDATLLSSLLPVTLAPAGLSSQLDGMFPGGFGFDQRNGRLYVCQTQSGSNRMEDLKYQGTNVSQKNGRLKLKNDVLSDLYPGTETFLVRLSMMKIKKFGTRWNYADEQAYGQAMELNRTINGKDGVLTRYLGGNQYSFAGVDDSRYGALVRDSDGIIKCGFNFDFIGSDASRFRWERSGAAITYTCEDGFVVEPVISVTPEYNDEGNGGSVVWMYEESRQVMQHGTEKVPGGIVVPYDLQTMICTYENKYDHRTFSCTYEFYLEHRVNCYPFVGATNTRYATVYLLPMKHIKYLYKYVTASSTQSFRHKLMRLGEYDFTDKGQYLFTSNLMYQEGMGLSAHFVENSTPAARHSPWKDFDVRYVGGRDGIFQGNTAWSQAAMNFLQDMNKNFVRIFMDPPQKSEMLIQDGRKEIERVELLPATGLSTNGLGSTYRPFGIYVNTYADF